MLDLEFIYQRTQSDPPCVSTGATILETRDLIEALREAWQRETQVVTSLTQELIDVKKKDSLLIAQLTAERDAAQAALSNATSSFNKSLCAGCVTLVEQTSQLAEAQAQIAALTAERDAACSDEADTLATLDAHKLVLSAYQAQIAELTAERNEYAAALRDIHECWMIDLSTTRQETRAAIDRALGD